MVREAEQTRGRAKVTVVVPVLNAIRTLEPCLSSVTVAMAASTSAEVELILVDNGSTDGSLESMRERWGDRARIVVLPGANVGAVRNRGVREGTGDVLSFIDSDCVVGPDYFDCAVEALRATGAEATGSPYALPDRPVWVETIWHRLHESRPRGPVKYLNAGNFVCRRAAFEAVGGFDEDLATGEDAELCLRFRELGFAIVEDPSVVAKHLGNPKSLGHFYRKQRWHGLGMFGTFRRDRFDLPVLATVGHLALLVGALILVARRPASGAAWLAGVGLLLAVPVAAVAFRGFTSRRLPPVLGGIVLYSVYFAARLSALLLVAVRSGSRALRG